MKGGRRLLVYGALALLALIVIRAVVGSKTDEPAASAEWKVIGSYSGSGVKQTPSFTTGGTEIKISWESKPQRQDLNVFQVYVYHEDGTLVGVAANTTVGGEDDKLVRLSPGTYYLAINSGVNWKVKVENR